MTSARSSASEAGRLDTLDRSIISLALPAFGALAAEPLYRLVDTAVVGRLGTAQLGGVAVAVSVLALVIAGSNFLAYGTTQRLANRLGAGDNVGAADVGTQALWLATIIGLIAAPLLAVFARPLALAIGAEDDVLMFAVIYLRISAIGVPFVIIGLAAQGAQRGARDYWTPLRVLIIANVLNVVIELVLVFAFDLGVAGAAWSTVVAQIFAGVALTWSTRTHVRGASTMRPRWSDMKPLISAGRHLLLRVTAMLLVFTGATAVAARVDDPTLAAHQIAISMFLFLALSLDALAVPAQTLVAEQLGKGESGSRSSASMVSRRIIRISRMVGFTLAAVVALSAPLVSRLFTSDPAVVSRATVALVFLGAVLVPGSLAFATDGSLIGAADYRFLGRAALFYLLAVVPIGAAVLAFDGFGIAGIWTGLLVWMSLRAVINSRRVEHVLPAA